MESLELRIDNMSCGACVARVTRALEAVPGVRVDRVSVGSARVELDPARTEPASIIRALKDAGYPAETTRSER